MASTPPLRAPAHICSSIEWNRSTVQLQRATASVAKPEPESATSRPRADPTRTSNEPGADPYPIWTSNQQKINILFFKKDYFLFVSHFFPFFRINIFLKNCRKTNYLRNKERFFV